MPKNNELLDRGWFNLWRFSFEKIIDPVFFFAGDLQKVFVKSWWKVEEPGEPDRNSQNNGEKGTHQLDATKPEENQFLNSDFKLKIWYLRPDNVESSQFNWHRIRFEIRTS